MTAKTHASIQDLYNVPDDGKAEIVNGELVLMSPTGDIPSSAGGAIYASQRQYQYTTKHGRAYPDNAGFVVDLPNRGSFSPDAAFYEGPRAGGKFLDGAPLFAAEVRSEGDFGRAAERAMAAKRADYFAAGALVVWDVDVLRDEIVRVYRASDPNQPVLYRRGEIAEAEPAVPGWRMAVEDLFA